MEKIEQSHYLKVHRKERFELLLTDWFIITGALNERKETLLTEKGSKTVSYEPEWCVLAIVLLPCGYRLFSNTFSFKVFWSL